MNDEIGKHFHEAIDKLREERDELRVQMHLAAAEVRDEFEELEEKWSQLETRLRAASREAARPRRACRLAHLSIGEGTPVAPRRTA